MEKYQCSRCNKWVEYKDIDVYHFKSVHKHHTLLSKQMCIQCRDIVFDFIDGVDTQPECEECETWPLSMCDYCPTCGKKLS